MTDKSGIEKAMAAIQNSRQESHRMGNTQFVIDVPDCKTTLYLTRNNETQRMYNVELVRGYFETHLGCSIKEAAADLDLSYDRVHRAVQYLRAEWHKK
jgi:hypothetical protein